MDETVTIEIDRDTYEQLAQQARINGHSIDEEAAALVRNSIIPRVDGEIDFVAWSRRIRAMTPKGANQTDSLALLREDRDR